MAKSIKSFDDLYREVLGEEPPKKKGSVSSASKDETDKTRHKKTQDVLSDPTKRKDVQKLVLHLERSAGLKQKRDTM